jgi:hypothetical protein
MKWEAFKDKFHPSWHARMQPFIESEECDKIRKKKEVNVVNVSTLNK